ncbi:MAG: PilZ domain-containing protein, partial [Myxococcota bacterium]
METTETFELRENVEVDIVLLFCDTQVTLAGEVVHIVPPEMASAGGKPGVAIQFSYAPAEVAGRLEPLLAAGGVTAPPRRVDSGRRRAPRTPARVPVRIDGAGAAVQGTARNLSNSGVLVATPAGGIRVGQNVRIAVENPTTGEVLEIDGTVMREIASGGEVAAVGIQFDPADDERSGVELFLEQVQSIEHTRRLGGIEGPIDELGPQNLLQMFGNAAPAGTLVLRNGEEEGLIGFENKLLRYARLGSASGMKALVRMLSWEQGNFEFHASLEPMDEADAPLPLEAAIFEAVREMDETSRIDQSRMP